MSSRDDSGLVNCQGPCFQVKDIVKKIGEKIEN